MECRESSIVSFTITKHVLPHVGVFIFIILVFNFSGNTLLIWALKKTGQTKTISSQFIIIMSISDLIISTNSLIIVIINLIPQKNSSICWIYILFQFLMTTSNMFSYHMIALIALDRYLHMRYLQRYPFVVTKKRGYFITVACIMSAIAVNVILYLPLPYNVPYISQSVYIFISFPVTCSIFILYHKAMKALRTKASQLTRRVIAETRTLSKAAMRITICVLVLTLPPIIIQILELINKHHKFIASNLLENLKLFSYITFISNAFWSSYIFISLNTPIRLLLRRFASGCPCQWKISAIGSMDKDI